MRIGGFQPLTLSDYPGLMAAMIFTQGCNFRCPFCHNGSLWEVDPERAEPMPESAVYDFLEHRRGFLDGIVVSGGEPTIHPDIVAFIATLARKGLEVKLDTNGSRPAVLRELLDCHLLDYVAMDIKAPFDKYALLAGTETSVERIDESIGLLIASGVMHEFRTTFVPGLLTEEDIEVIRSYLPQGARYTVQEFVPDHAADASLRLGSQPAARATAPPPMTGDSENLDLPGHIEFLSGE